jgi:hypothetical protein
MKRIALVAVALAVSPLALHAVVSLPHVFGDNMVLQCGQKVPVWGKADPGENVTVSFAGQTVSATADAKGAWRIFKRDRRNHTSPNSAHTEAACAGALDVQLGGGHYYFGEYVEKPTIGDDVRPIETEDIKRANKLMYATAGLGLGVAAVLGLMRKR